MDRNDVIDYLASLTDSEFREITAQARGASVLDAQELIERELARQTSDGAD